MRVGVVGGGITGLATVHALRERDLDVVAFESADRPGGVIHSEERDGRILEYGPQRLRLTDELETLVDELDLRDELRYADPDLPLFVYANDALRTVPRDIGAFLRTDALSIRGELRILLEPLTKAGQPDESAGDLLERKFGSEAYETIIEPLLSGVYAADPRDMPADHALAPILALEDRYGSLLRAAFQHIRERDDAPPIISFDHGLSTLTDALYRAHADGIRLGEAVTAIRPVNDDFEIETAGGRTRVDEVVVTVPAPTAAAILELSDADVDALSRLTYSPLAIVHLESTFGGEGLGYQVRRDTDLSTLGVTWNDSLFDRERVYTAFLGGTRHPEVIERAPSELGAIASEEFETVTGAPADVLDVSTWAAAVPSYDDTWTALETLTLPAGVTLATNYTGRIGVPGRLREATTVAAAIADRGT